MQDLQPWGEAEQHRPAFTRIALIAAGVYNLAWGLAVILFPTALFTWSGLEAPRYPQIWQCVGMIVGVYGVGYLIAARDPFRHWPIVLVGLLGKIFGPVGFLMSAIAGDLPWAWGVTLIFNDLIWWVPFAAILYLAAKHHGDTSLGRPHDLSDAMVLFASQRGRSLAELSQQGPLMIVFLRHFGCTFCREALADLARARGQLSELGVQMALVHMSDDRTADGILKQYRLEDIDHYSDANCEIYRSFGLQRASPFQLLGLTVLWRGLAATLCGHLAGPLAGDGFRMPGLFLVFRSEILGSYRHRTAADRPDYVELAREFQTLLQKQAKAS